MTITSSDNSIGLYVHVPFCLRKCRYCDFLSFECRDDRAIHQYANALMREIETRYEEWPYKVVDTVYIGGGTPSILSETDVKHIMECITDNFTVVDGSEITIEANPATIDEKKLETYLAAGINRISIGTQSFDNSILNMLGRVHNKNDALNAIRLAKKAGFKNINVDMMFGIPGQTLKMWRDSLRQCIFLGPEHISLYSLQIEEGTPFYQMMEKGTIDQVSENTDRTMYHDALDMLENAGYNHYEISNAALPGFESRHNLKYWSYKEYLGMGLGASSFIGGYRFKNTSSMLEYVDFIKQGLPPVKKEDVENYSLRDEMGIYVFTALRKREGFDIRDFEETFGTDFFYVYDPMLITKLRGLIKMDGFVMKLTDKGLDVSNQVMAEFV